MVCGGQAIACDLHPMAHGIISLAWSKLAVIGREEKGGGDGSGF